jgi:hypothetical protein
MYSLAEFLTSLYMDVVTESSGGSKLDMDLRIGRPLDAGRRSEHRDLLPAFLYQ